ncbi:hypothetical protein ACIBJF_52435 [Streptomyces sp. NPDC050743]|uniref:hypothetical protein n=1 Tax=Streptomyces sp. NPDC050743 TaxID=3365634 RepID=UPI0037AC2C92
MAVPSPAEERLAAAYAALLTRVSACAQAIENGHWGYLQAKAGEASEAAAELEAAAEMVLSGRGLADPRAALAEVLSRAGNEPAVRALHDLGPGAGGLRSET